MNEAPSAPLERYSATAIALHWGLALLILLNLALGLYAVDLPLSPQKLKYLSWHKWLGMSALLVAAIRILWRLTHEDPPPLETLAPWERRLAALSHTLLYGFFCGAAFRLAV